MADEHNSFALEVDGKNVASFAQGTGLSSDTSEITLKDGVGGGAYLANWFKEVQDGKFNSYRRSGAIVMYDPQGSETSRWNFVIGWPKEWKASDLDAGADPVATEELTIAHEGLTRA